MTRVAMTVRINYSEALKITRIAHDAGLSDNQVAAALIMRALAEGWTVKAGSQPVAVEE